MGCIEKERTTRGKAAEENNRKTDFMLGGLHLIFGVRSSSWIYCHLVVRDSSVGAPETSQETKAVVRVDVGRSARSEKSKRDPLSQADGVMHTCAIRAQLQCAGVFPQRRACLPGFHLSSSPFCRKQVKRNCWKDLRKERKSATKFSLRLKPHG